MPRFARALATTTVAACCTSLIAASACVAAPSPSFGPPRGPDVEISCTSRTSPTLAGDGAGNWVLCYLGNEPGTTAVRWDLFCSTSADGGRSWSTPQFLFAEFPSPSVATDGEGTWILASHNFGDPTSIRVLRSVDNGGTWTEQASPSGSLDYNGQPKVIHSDGAWVVVWASFDDLAGGIHSHRELLVSRSLDDGASWSAPVLLDPGAHGDNAQARDHELASDSATVVAVWTHDPDIGKNDIVVSRSLDAGQTWSAPSVIVPDPSEVQEHTPAVATDGQGNWLAAWAGTVPDGGGTSIRDTFVTTSNDNAVSWSAALSLPEAAGLSLEDLRINREPAVAGVPGGWLAAWTSSNSLERAIGEDLDLLASFSADGVSWSSAVTVNATAGNDHGKGPDLLDSLSVLATDSAGRTIAAWVHEEFVGVQFFTIQYEIKPRLARLLQCPADPIAGCKPAGRARLKLRNRSGGRDDLRWSWKRGPATGAAELGDPTSTSDYELCLYDSFAAPTTLVASSRLAAGGSCGTRQCWKSPRPEFFGYGDKPLVRGAVRKAGLSGGAAGKAKIKLGARGAHLGPPVLPVAGDLTVQLRNSETGACWESVHTEIKRNDAESYDGSTP